MREITHKLFVLVSLLSEAMDGVLYLLKDDSYLIMRGECEEYIVTGSVEISPLERGLDISERSKNPLKNPPTYPRLNPSKNQNVGKGNLQVDDEALPLLGRIIKNPHLANIWVGRAKEKIEFPFVFVLPSTDDLSHPLVIRVYRIEDARRASEGILWRYDDGIFCEDIFFLNASSLERSSSLRY